MGETVLQCKEMVLPTLGATEMVALRALVEDAPVVQRGPLTASGIRRHFTSARTKRASMHKVIRSSGSVD